MTQKHRHCETPAAPVRCWSATGPFHADCHNDGGFHWRGRRQSRQFPLQGIPKSFISECRYRAFSIQSHGTAKACTMWSFGKCVRNSLRSDSRISGQFQRFRIDGCGAAVGPRPSDGRATVPVAKCSGIGETGVGDILRLPRSRLPG